MDKTIYKVTGYLALVIGIFYCITIIGIIVGIPLIIGASIFLDYAKMSDEDLVKHKNSILGWSIVFLLLAFIPGILGIIGYFDINKINTSDANKKNTEEEQIRELNKLFKEGLITEEEFQKKKKKILDI